MTRSWLCAVIVVGHSARSGTDEHLRAATAEDGPELVRLWATLYDESDSSAQEPWRTHALGWFNRSVENALSARFPVVEVDGAILASAIGTLETGVPNPHCLRGRTVRLANVVTVPEYRGRGYGTTLVLDVVSWARHFNAHRVDLSATPAGQRIYAKAGLVVTTAPRLKLIL